MQSPMQFPKYQKHQAAVAAFDWFIPTNSGWMQASASGIKRQHLDLNEIKRSNIPCCPCSLACWETGPGAFARNLAAAESTWTLNTWKAARCMFSNAEAKSHGALLLEAIRIEQCRDPCNCLFRAQSREVRLSRLSRTRSWETYVARLAHELLKHTSRHLCNCISQLWSWVHFKLQVKLLPSKCTSKDQIGGLGPWKQTRKPCKVSFLCQHQKTRNSQLGVSDAPKSARAATFLR